MRQVSSTPYQPSFRPYLTEEDNLNENREEIVYDLTDFKGLPDRLVIPEGYLTDGASIPWMFRWIIGQPFWPRFQRATLPHDFIYKEQLCASRRDADRLMLAILKQSRVEWWRRKAMWLGVHVGGGFPWRKYRRNHDHGGASTGREGREGT